MHLATAARTDNLATQAAVLTAVAIYSRCPNIVKNVIYRIYSFPYGTMDGSDGTSSLVSTFIQRMKHAAVSCEVFPGHAMEVIGPKTNG